MSDLLEYLNKVEKEVDKWPAWKKKSLKDAFYIPTSKQSNAHGNFNYIIPSKQSHLLCINH